MTSVTIPLRIRVIAYLTAACLGGIGTIGAAVLAWVHVEHWVDDATSVMLGIVVTAILGIAAAMCGLLSLNNLTIPDVAPGSSAAPDAPAGGDPAVTMDNAQTAKIGKDVEAAIGRATKKTATPAPAKSAQSGRA